MTTRIQFRRGIASNWTITNPILYQGELGLELGTNSIKIGDGVADWNSLNYSKFLPVQTGNSGKYLTTNGTDATWASTTGTGTLVLSTSPTLITPVLGTPTSGDLSNCTNAVGYGLKSASTTVSISAATAPSTGQILTATSGTTATWQSPAGGLPAQTSNSGKYLTTDGTTASWASGTGTGTLVLATSPTIDSPRLTTSALVGPSASANLTRFPNALAVVSSTSAGIQQNESHNIGLIAEGTAHATNTAIYGIGVYGVGYTNAGTRAGGVVGEGHVTVTGDTGSAIGVRGYANDTHAGGMNIGLFAEASGSSTNNYALYMNSGNITNIAAQTWNLGGNLTFSGAYTVAVPTLSLTNALAVASGGTGANSLTLNNVLLGNGTSAVQAIPPGTSGNVLTSNGTTWVSAAATGGSGGSATKTISNKTAAYTVVAGDLGKIINCTSGSFTVTLTAAATLGSGFTCTIWNTSDTYTDVITIDPNGTETIDGMSTLIVNRAEGIDIVSNGTNWQLGYKRGMRGYNENYLTVYTRNVVSGSNALAIGRAHTASGIDSFAIGAYGCTASNYATFAAGVNCIASGNASSAIGNNSTGYQGAQAVGSGAMALGGSYASGADSFAAAIANNTSTYGAKATGAIAVGLQSAATGNGSIALGYNSATASNYNSLAIGYVCTADGHTSVAIGDGAHTKGVRGKFVFSPCSYSSFVSPGSIQSGKIVMVASTTTTTTVVLTSDAGVASTNNQLIVQSNQAMTFFGILIAKQSASNNMASYKVSGAISNNAGTMALADVTVEKIVDTIGLTTEPTFTADSTNKALAVTSGAKVTTNIRWVMNIDSVEVTYA